MCQWWTSKAELREVTRITEIVRERLGHEVSLDDAYEVWRQHSEKLCAGFLCVDTEQEVVDVFKEYYKLK